MLPATRSKRKATAPEVPLFPFETLEDIPAFYGALRVSDIKDLLSTRGVVFPKGAKKATLVSLAVANHAALQPMHNKKPKAAVAAPKAPDVTDKESPIDLTSPPSSVDESVKNCLARLLPGLLDKVVSKLALQSPTLHEPAAPSSERHVKLMDLRSRFAHLGASRTPTLVPALTFLNSPCEESENWDLACSIHAETLAAAPANVPLLRDCSNPSCAARVPDGSTSCNLCHAPPRQHSGPMFAPSPASPRSPVANISGTSTAYPVPHGVPVSIVASIKNNSFVDLSFFVYAVMLDRAAFIAASLQADTISVQKIANARAGTSKAVAAKSTLKEPPPITSTQALLSALRRFLSVRAHAFHTVPDFIAADNRDLRRIEDWSTRPSFNIPNFLFQFAQHHLDMSGRLDPPPLLPCPAQGFPHVDLIEIFASPAPVTPSPRSDRRLDRDRKLVRSDFKSLGSSNVKGRDDLPLIKLGALCFNKACYNYNGRLECDGTRIFAGATSHPVHKCPMCNGNHPALDCPSPTHNIVMKK